MNNVLKSTTGEKFSGAVRVLGCYCCWFAIILVLYWPGILIFPKKDHTIFMLGRHLATSDMGWFFGVLSYTRTRILLPGDYFGFRPVHMAVIALEDLFFRHQFAIQGIICCAIFAFAATTFFYLLRRISPLVLAFSITLLWISQIAGSDIVLWQHINPYLLSPAFLFLAAYLATDDQYTRTKAVIAALSVFLSCLTHEISVIISCLLSFISLMPILPKTILRNRCITVFLLPALAALALNALDYFVVHPPPSLLSPADVIANDTWQGTLHQISQFLGAIGVAMAVPSQIVMGFGDGWLHTWSFWALPEYILLTSALLISVIIVAACVFAGFRLVRFGITPSNLVLCLFLLIYFSSAGVSLFRILSRGLIYMATATYYFSLTSLALCGICAVILAGRKKPYLYCGCVLLFLLAAWHAYELRRQLLIVEPAKQQTANGMKYVRQQLQQNPAVCFNGIDLLSTPVDWHLWSPLFQDLSCTVRPNALPVYLSLSDGTVILATLKAVAPPTTYSNILPLVTDDKTGTISQGNYRPTLNFELPIKLGIPIEFSLWNSPVFGVSIEGINDKSFGVEIDYNLIWGIDGNSKFLLNSTTWNPARQEIAYKLFYATQGIFLFGNEQLLSFWPVDTKNENQLMVKFWARTSSSPLFLSRLMVAKYPAVGQIVMDRF
jgi:hypothetical protein